VPAQPLCCGLTWISAGQLSTARRVTAFAAGPADAKQRVQPVFDAIGSKTVWLDTVGDPSRLKLVSNNWVLGVTGATAETLALAQALGVDAGAFLEAVSGGSLDCDYMRIKAEAITKGDYEPSFTVELSGEDADLIVAASQSAGCARTSPRR
jgi:3-hydroxyisobutyrate dehydrogenase